MSRHATAVTPDRRLLPAAPGGERIAPLLLALALFLAGVGALLTLPHKHVPDPLAERAAEAATSRALPRTRDGRVLVHRSDAGFLGVVLDRTNPRVLHVVVARGTRAVDCDVLRPVPTITRQDASGVRLVVAGYEYVPRAAARRDTGGTTCVTAGSRDVTIRLRQPLGGRRLYEGSSPESTTVADPADFPEPTTLPSGYTTLRARPVRPEVGRLVATRRWSDGTDTLTLRIGSRYDVMASGPQMRDSKVAGSYALVTKTDNRRCVTWNELSGRVRQLCGAGASMVPRATLIDIARSLP